MKKPILVAVDGGSGNISLRFELNGKIESASIPALVREGNAQSFDSEDSASWSTVDEYGQERTYSVVSRGTGLIDTCDPQYQVSAAQRVLIVNALAQAGLGGRDIILSDTLPISQYFGSDSKINVARIEAKKASLMTPVTNCTGKLAAPRILGVKIFPEAVTAVISATINPDGSVNEKFSRVQGKVVIDLGRFTCDIAYLDESNKIVARYTSENGVHTMLKEIRSMLEANEATLGIKEAGEIPLDSIDRFIRDGGRIASAWDDSDAIDITRFIDQAATNLIHRIKEDIRACVRNLTDIDVLLVVGGGANYIGGKLPFLAHQDLRAAWGKPVFIPDFPELAIVRGVHLSMQFTADDLIAEFVTDKTEA
ncbi:TPA: ParM/StbA family protein [Enterobacter hormaechei subsp. xiangfangensis]|nr:ParM/StbA family protein [Enterobacter hormaechei subsp. xiangfangensis]